MLGTAGRARRPRGEGRDAGGVGGGWGDRAVRWSVWPWVRHLCTSAESRLVVRGEDVAPGLREQVLRAAERVLCALLRRRRRNARAHPEERCRACHRVGQSSAGVDRCLPGYGGRFYPAAVGSLVFGGVADSTRWLVSDTERPRRDKPGCFNDNPPLTREPPNKFLHTHRIVLSISLRTR